jgi:hypothetical protein
MHVCAMALMPYGKGGGQGAAALWPSTGSLLTAVIAHNVLSIGLTRFSSRAVRAVSYHAQLGSPTIYW